MTASIPAPGTSDGTIIAAASPDGRTLAAIDGGHVFFDNVASRAVTATVAPANDGSSLTAEAFSPDGSTLAVADTIGTVFLYDTATHALRATLAAPDDFTLYSVAFSPDGKTFAGADTESGDTYLWNTATVKRTATIPGPGAGVAGSAPSAREDTVAFAPDGRTLATLGLDGTIDLWRLSNS
jgi:WD40 repeat protein